MTNVSLWCGILIAGEAGMGAGDYVGALCTFHSSCQPTNYIPNIFKGTLSGVVVFKIVAIK